MAEDIVLATVADEDLLDEVGKRGYFAAKQPPQRGDTFNIGVRGKSFKFGVVSDKLSPLPVMVLKNPTVSVKV